MSKLTKREIVLLNALLFVSVIGLGVVMWISPLMNEISALKLEKQELSTQQTTMNYLIQNEKTINDKYVKVSQEINKQQESFTQSITHLEITNYVKEAGMKVLNLERSDTQVVPVEIYTSNRPNYDYELNNVLELIKPTNKKEVIEASKDKISLQTITIKVNGSLAQGEKLVTILNSNIKTGFVDLFERDDLLNEMTLRISIYSLQPSSTDY